MPLFRLIHGLNDGSTDATFLFDENPDRTRYEPATDPTADVPPAAKPSKKPSDVPAAPESLEEKV